MVKDYYETYLQMLKNPKDNSESPKKTPVIGFWKELAEQKGYLMAISLFIYLAIFVIICCLIILSVFFRFHCFKGIMLLSLIWMIVFIVLAILDKKWESRRIFLNIEYYESINRALDFKKALAEKFKFTCSEQYAMILSAAQKQYIEMHSRSEKKQKRADQILFGGILAILLAFAPAVMIGLMDNLDLTANTISGELFSIIAATGIIPFFSILIMSFIYFATILDARKLEKEEQQFSRFLSDIEMLTEIEAGLHPRAKQNPAYTPPKSLSTSTEKEDTP